MSEFTATALFGKRSQLGGVNRMGIWATWFGTRRDVRENMPPADPLLIVPIPALVTVLLHHEKEKGVPLTEQEVSDIRDKAICMTMRRSHLEAMAEARGYDDIDPERAWEEWSVIRLTLL